MVREGVTARDARDSALIALRAAHVDSPELDADLLVAHALGTDRAGLRLDPGRELDSAGTRWLRDAVRRRAVEREPIAYLLGEKGFRNIVLAVDARVLIPRPETEHLVEAVLDLPRGAHVHDACTGSGAVALALADERPDLVISASDISAEALAVARANAARLGLAVTFSEGPLLAGITEVDAIVANPPYVRSDERGRLAPEISRHEPQGALLAGDDGLAVIGPLVAEAAATRARTLALEVGAGQAAAVAALIADAGFAGTETVADLAGIERVVVGRR